MKNFAVVLSLLFALQVTYSQKRIVTGGLTAFSPNGNSQGPGAIQPTVHSSPHGNLGSLYSQSKKYNYEDIISDGSQFLFSTWENSSNLFTKDKKYTIGNINFNMDKQMFMSKFNDSVFVHNFKAYDKISINGKVFKSIYNNDEQKDKVYEVVYSDDDFSVLKENYISIKEASPNPMLNRPIRKIIHKSKYFTFSNNEEIVKLKLKKAELLKLFGDDKKQQLENYVKSKRLSYKKPEDIDKMLNYINRLQVH